MDTFRPCVKELLCLSTHNALTNQTANLYILSECGGCSLLASVIVVGGVGMYPFMCVHVWKVCVGCVCT